MYLGYNEYLVGTASTKSEAEDKAKEYRELSKDWIYPLLPRVGQDKAKTVDMSMALPSIIGDGVSEKYSTVSYVFPYYVVQDGFDYREQAEKSARATRRSNEYCYCHVLPTDLVPEFTALLVERGYRQ